MTRGILIALLVPTIALAGPKKKPRAKRPPPVETTAPEPAPAPAPPAAAAATAPVTPTAAGTSPQSGTQPAPGTAPSGGGTPDPDAGATEDAAAGGPDIDTLRQEYLSLRDELFKSRARANAIASQLYSTRISIKLTWASARYYGVSKASIRLDGATVFEDGSGAIATDDGVRFDGYVAPGRHLVTFHVEATGKDDDTFTSASETQVVVKAVANKDLLVAAKARDNGDIAYEWKRNERGSYGLGIDVAVKSIPRATAGASKK